LECFRHRFQLLFRLRHQCPGFADFFAAADDDSVASVQPVAIVPAVAGVQPVACVPAVAGVPAVSGFFAVTHFIGLLCHGDDEKTIKYLASDQYRYI